MYSVGLYRSGVCIVRVGDVRCGKQKGGVSRWSWKRRYGIKITNNGKVGEANEKGMSPPVSGEFKLGRFKHQ